MKFRLILSALACGFLLSASAYSMEAPWGSVFVPDENGGAGEWHEEVIGEGHTRRWRTSHEDGVYRMTMKENFFKEEGNPEGVAHILEQFKRAEHQLERAERQRRLKKGLLISSAVASVLAVAAGIGGLCYYFQKSEPQAEESASEALPESN